ncbi:unnamed protein product [Rangifer tarandus platyrhynchus]|uniref:Uncharacterized protein n=1 Tax=Rangifer tarandus platyrhynchus TaxID=3082113 RepID=A0ABN8ZS47_RANTA|nr:unnamed protein product [Rangifer tarandus platyrhynchus]
MSACRQKKHTANFQILGVENYPITCRSFKFSSQSEKAGVTRGVSFCVSTLRAWAVPIARQRKEAYCGGGAYQAAQTSGCGGKGRRLQLGRAWISVTNRVSEDLYSRPCFQRRLPPL